jgi:O-antigen/teichoic acid export membrane protein
MTAVALPRHALGNAARYLSVSAVSMALPFVTLPIMTRWLTPADYGIVALAQVIASFFVGIAGLGLSAGLERAFFKYEHDSHALASVMHSALAVVALTSAVLAVVLGCVSGALAQGLYGEARWGPVLTFMALTSALGVIIAACLSYERNRGRARAFMRWSVAGLLLESGLSVTLVAVADFGVWGLVLGAFVGKVVVAPLMWTRLAHELRPRFDFGMVREMLSVGLPLLPRTFLGAADGGIDRMLVTWLASLGQVGLFGMANRIGYSVFSLMTSLEQVYMPEVYRAMFRDGEAAHGRLGAYLNPYFLASVMAPTLVAIFIEEILWVLVTPAFYGVAPIAAILSVYYGQMFFGKIVGAQLIYAKKTWYSTPLAGIRVAIHLGAALALIAPFGALGAAIALLLTGLIVDSLGVAVGQRVYRIRYDLRTVIPAMVCLYAAMLWTVVAPWWGLPYAERLLGKAILVGALLAVGWRWLSVAQVRNLFRAARMARA